MEFLARIGVTLCVIGILAVSADAQGRIAREDQVQAAFFYKFQGYVERTKALSQPPDSLARLCVLGETPISTILEELSRANRSTALIERPRDAKAARSCSLVFISSSEGGRLEQILSVLDGSGAVTVSDLPDFADRGGMIQFITQDQHVKFIVNQRSAERQGVRISSQLLALAFRRDG